MGQEIACKIRYQERTLAGTAYLESDHVLFRGDQRLKVAFTDMTGIEAKAGVLRLDFVGGPAEFELGEKAEKWANKILNPPSRLHKLGVKTGMSVRLLGNFDEDFLEDLRNCRVEMAGEKADLIFLAAEGKSRLSQIRKLMLQMKPEGALWVIYPKGVDTIREIDVITAGRNAHLKDSKVASFSLTHTGLRFVVPLPMRKHLK